MKRFFSILLFAFLAPICIGQEPNSNADEALAKQGVAFLKTYCQKCHGDDFRYPALDVTNRATLLSPKDSAEKPFIVPGKLDDSRLWEAVETDYMPPERQPQPTAEEREAFKKWIEAGAPFPAEIRQEREFRGEESVLAAIEQDLRNLPDDQIPHTRYFSLAHLWNDTTGKEPTTEEDLRLTRAALSKLVNSLSSKSRIVVPRVVDGEFATVLAIDMRDYGWDDWHWNEVLKTYPYALKVSSQAATNIYRQTQTRVPYLRADWFVAKASRPPLYHTLLSIPQNAQALEAGLGVDVLRNYQTGKLSRAAFQKSGVSQQNRMAERHDTIGRIRYYWKSYDMLPTTAAEGDFTRRPLEPSSTQSGGAQLAPFKHDGGEIIWSLPNGLQGYMLVKGDDDRIDEGPIQVVFDPNMHSGSVAIVNGISCMGCHKHGMFPWEKDDIRPLFEGKRGQAIADKVLELYPPNETMQQLVQKDKKSFLIALEEAIGPFVKVGSDATRSIEDFPEPITRVSSRYLQDITAPIAQRELGISPAKQDILARPRLLRELGFANWLNPNGIVSREAWESGYGRLARELEIGVPIRVR
jgi:serine/threonine-protein kinase